MAQSVVLGFDYGHRRIGVAIGNRLTSTSRALTTLTRPQSEDDWANFENLIKQWSPESLVVGIPLQMDGQEQELTLAARRFARRLQARSKLQVHQVDERLSSAAASDELKDMRQSGKRSRRVRRGDVDSLAAALLVQQWLEEA